VGSQNVIVLRGDPTLDDTQTAAETITPGHLVAFDGSGNIVKHSVAAGNAQKLFAANLPERNQAIGDAFSTNDRVRLVRAHGGVRIHALVAAAAAAIAKGAPVESAGDGTVRALASSAATSEAQRDSVVGYAAEAVDNSGGGAEARIAIDIA